MTGPIAIVAAGVATPLGLDLETFWSGLVTGVDGTGRIERFDVHDLRVGRGGEIKKLTALADATATSCRASAVLLAAADDLLSHAALTADPARIAVVLGTALGGVDELERALGGARSPRVAAAGLYDGPAHALARRLEARGPVLTVSTACASGATSLGIGADLLNADAADLVVAGGYDVLGRFVMRGFDALRSLTRDRVRPFDRRRSGLLLGEAAGLVLLARDADARARLGRLLGHASSSDGSHIAAPDPDGRGLEHALRGAMAAAGIASADVDMISAHGTGTVLNDRIETAVVKRVLGRRAYAVPMNSIKGAIGHTMGAAATLEAIMCLLAARDGVVPSTLGFEEPDPACDLDYVPRAARHVRTRISLSTSLGFGGCNAALVLEGAS
ncbi:MAG TPA: beta-ketoacyl-[acyl-carrier-protein] synthase family protein [Methylomirabilota bacterium]|jgi:3-oxoacyl-(acyl-carrier-protein) synthase